MNTNKHFPLSKPPQVSEEKVAIPTPAVAQITQKRMTLLKRANKLFFAFGLLSLVAGLYSYLEWQKDSQKLVRYERIFERFPQSNSLEVNNSSQAVWTIGRMRIYYISSNEDSVKIFSEKRLRDIGPSNKHEYKIEESSITGNEPQLLFVDIRLKKEEEAGQTIVGLCPKDHVIPLK